MDNPINNDPAINNSNGHTVASLVDHQGHPIQMQQTLPTVDDACRRSHPSTESNDMVRLEGGPNHGTKLEIPDPTPVNRESTQAPPAETLNPSDQNLISQAFDGYAMQQIDHETDATTQQAMADFATGTTMAEQQPLITPNPNTLPMGLLPPGTIVEGGSAPAQLPTDYSDIRHPITGASVPVMQDHIDLSTFPYEINLHKDVVSGKGGKIQQINRHFRNLVAAQYPLYDSTSSKISKRKIGLNIYHDILEKGGRFLDQEGNVMDQNKALLKVMKALKDAKIWTSDQKRLAKRKRASKKNSNAGNPARIEKLVLPPEPPQQQDESYQDPPQAVAITVQELPLLNVNNGDETDKKENGLSLLYQAMDGNKMLTQDSV